MTEEGKRIASLMEQVLRLYRETQSLLVAADGLMSESSWTPISNVSITGSNSLEQPEQWFANVAHRFYKHTSPEHPRIVCFVAVALINAEEPERLPEPLAIAGWMECRPNVKPGRALFWYAGYHTYMPDSNSEGVLCRFEAEQRPKKKLPFRTMTTIAVPLVEITEAKILHSKIIKPLIKDMSTTLDL